MAYTPHFKTRLILVGGCSDARIAVLVKLLLIAVPLAIVSSPASAQASEERIEIAGVQVRPGITVDDALLLFQGKQLARHDAELYIEVTETFPGGRTLNGVIVGTLYIAKGIVTGACRPWNYSQSSDPPDSELARVLFALVNASASKEAILETSVQRTVQNTIETLLIRVGHRTIRISRYQTHVAPNPGLVALPPSVEVEECLFTPGWTLKEKQ